MPTNHLRSTWTLKLPKKKRENSPAIILSCWRDSQLDIKSGKFHKIKWLPAITYEILRVSRARLRVDDVRVQLSQLSCVGLQLLVLERCGFRFDRSEAGHPDNPVGDPANGLQMAPRWVLHVVPFGCEGIVLWYRFCLRNISLVIGRRSP